MTLLRTNSARALFLVLIAAGVGVPNAPAASLWGCEFLLHPISDATLRQIVQKFGQTDREVVIGAKTPTWQNFEDLRQFVGRVESQYTGPDIIAKAKELERDLAAIESNIIEEAKFDGDDLRRSVLGDEYEPGDYELRSVYRHALMKLNESLPEKIRLDLPKLPERRMSPKEVNAVAESVIERQSKVVEKSLFNLDPNFAHWADLKKSVDTYVAASAPAEGLAELRKVMADPDKLEYRMRRPENGRFWIPKSGFQNQRVTKTSKGSLNPAGRTSSEASHLGTSVDDFTGLHPDIFPKYGYLGFTPESGFTGKSFESSSRHYGSDVYIFKKDRVRKRMTFTIGDSLGYGDYYGGASTSHLKITFGNQFAPMDHFAESVGFLRRNGADVSIRGSFANHSSSFYYSSSYLELQFYGTLGLEDVESFIFTGTPPEGEFLEELLARKIKIYDARSADYSSTLDKRVEWVPPPEISPPNPKSVWEKIRGDKPIPTASDLLTKLTGTSPSLAAKLPGTVPALKSAVAPISDATVAKLFPTKLPGDWKLSEGAGRVMIVPEVDFSYYAQRIAGGETLFLPMSSSRLSPGWVSTPEWWTAHAAEIEKARLAKTPMPFQDRGEVAAWLKANGLSANPNVFLASESGAIRSVPLKKYLLDHILTEWDVKDGKVTLYRGAERETELSSWVSGVRPRGARYWTPSATYAWRYGRKQPGLIRNLIKNAAPIVKFQVPVSEFLRAVEGRDLVLGTELTKKAHQSFTTSGKFIDHFNNMPYVGSGVFAPDVEIRATTGGVRMFPGYFAGPATIDDLATERILLIKKAAKRVEGQFLDGTNSAAEMLKRIPRVEAERELLLAMQRKESVERIKELLRKLPSGPAEITHNDHETLEQVVGEYVLGRL